MNGKYISDFLSKAKQLFEGARTLLPLSERMPFCGYDVVTKTFILEDAVNRAVIFKLTFDSCYQKAISEVYSRIPENQGWVLQEFMDVQCHGEVILVLYKRYTRRDGRAFLNVDPAQEVNKLFSTLHETSDVFVLNRLTVREAYTFISNVVMSENISEIDAIENLDEVVNESLQELLAGNTQLDEKAGSLVNASNERQSFFVEIGQLRKPPIESELSGINLDIDRNCSVFFVKTNTFEIEISNCGVNGDKGLRAQQIRSGFWVQAETPEELVELFDQLTTELSLINMTAIKLTDGTSGINALIGLIPANYKIHQDNGYFLRPIYLENASNLSFQLKEAC